MSSRRPNMLLALALLVTPAARSAGQSSISVSLVNPGPDSVEVAAPFELQIIATFSHRLTAVAYQLEAGGSAQAWMTARSADPDEINGLTFLSLTSQDPFESNLPHDFATGPVMELLIDLYYDDVPGGPTDGLYPGEDVILERVEITPTTIGSLTITLSDLLAVTTQEDPDSEPFDSITIDSDSITVNVTDTPPELRADAGNDQTISIYDPACTLSGGASGGTAPYTFHWVVENQPAGSGTVILEPADAPVAGVTITQPVVEGCYRMRLEVTDSTQDTASDTVNVFVWPSIPADSDYNWLVDFDEMMAYVYAWKVGNSWPHGPVPIPTHYMIKSAWIWQNGKDYHYEPSLDCPACWRLGAAQAQGAGSPSERVITLAHGGQGTAQEDPPAGLVGLRSFQADENRPGRYLVRIEAAFPPGTVVGAVEEKPPTGWTVNTVGQEGVFDRRRRKVKWGPFFEDTPRTFSYEVTRPRVPIGADVFSGVLGADMAKTIIGGADRPEETELEQPVLSEDSRVYCGTGILEACLLTMSMTILFCRRQGRSKPRYTWVKKKKRRIFP